MRNLFTFFLLAAICLILPGCSRHSHTVATESYEFEDSVFSTRATMNVELPSELTDPICKNIYDDLCRVLHEQIISVSDSDDDSAVEVFDNTGDPSSMVSYYGKKLLELIGELSMADFNERKEWVEQDSTLTEEEKQEIIVSYPGWEFDVEVNLVDQTERYVVFLSQNYIYMGGAHGGMTGAGYQTYDIRSGKRLESFLKDGVEDEMQSLLEEGLISYFKDCGQECTRETLRDYLFLDDERIPLPEYLPFPTQDGLGFMYQQYEIAAYAIGMPSFNISYDKVLPYLTPEAVDLLGL